MSIAIPGLPGNDRPIRPPLVMGILNLTPDSFSDGGLWTNPATALDHALSMAAAGADILDLGGESTRPGAGPVSDDQELQRVVPLIDQIRARVPTPISIDTSKPEVMREAVAAGASMINDVRGLRDEGALGAAAGLGVPVCLMHMLGEPRSMQTQPRYQDVVGEVESFLLDRARECESTGIPSGRIVLDPGFGFGKTLQHNIELFRAIPRLSGLGYPLLIGISRKSMLGAITGRAVGDRLAASVAGAVLAAQAGASIVRVHDVPETVDALKFLAATGSQ
ncbi:dihydropteroate synthase [Elongatibacter sediminis]|uniref:Dihydropteroate synthase n=1 Tax=Elongatibacter sediminis TaxID=3119006 RepID=A0AAW9R675_9GAMM